MRFLPIGIEVHHTCIAFIESTLNQTEESIAFQKEPLGVRTQICDYCEVGIEIREGRIIALWRVPSAVSSQAPFLGGRLRKNHFTKK